MKRSVIEIVSNVRCRIHNLDDSRAESLDHALSFTIKGSFFTGRVKRFGWDGKTHLFNIHGHSFPKGLLGKVIRLFEDNGWKYRLEDSRRNVLPPPKLSRLHPDMLHGVSLSGAYSFQLDAARKALKAGSGILWLATNAGKSTVAAAMIATDPKVQTLVVVPKVNLAYQFRDELAERFGTVKQNIGLIGAGHFDVRPITVAVVNSLQRKRGKRSAKRNAALSDLFKQVRRVFFDECHHLKAKMWKKVSRALVNAQFRYGLSGSAMTGEGDDLQVLAEVGPIVARVKNKKLIKLGVSAKPTVEMVTIDEPQIDSGSWDEVYKQGIVMNAQRNRHITLAVRQDVDDGMPSLVLVREIWHGELLSQMFKLNKIPHKFIHGELPPSAQREAIHAFDDEMLPAMIATTGLLDEGISIKAIRRITFADGYKSLRLTLQKLGRALRAKRSGENVVLIRDFADATHKWLAGHALERYEIFESEGFKIICIDPNEEPKKVTKQNMVVHCKKDKYDVYIGRPSKWGNPFSHKQGTIAKFKVKSLEEAISSYEIWIKSQPNLMKDLHELRGKVLGCWCKPGSCHGDVLARLANSKTDPITALAKSWGLGK